MLNLVPVIDQGGGIGRVMGSALVPVPIPVPVAFRSDFLFDIRRSHLECFCFYRIKIVYILLQANLSGSLQAYLSYELLFWVNTLKRYHLSSLKSNNLFLLLKTANFNNERYSDTLRAQHSRFA